MSDFETRPRCRSAWVYPWDLERNGVDRMVSEAQSLGLEALNVAATYHSITAWSPRYNAPTYLKSGGVFFGPRKDRYRGLTPYTPMENSGSTWTETGIALAARGMRMRAWVPVLAQPWVVDAAPQCATEYVSGARDPRSVCPSSEEFGEYFRAMVADMCSLHDLELVLLEGLTPAPFAHGWTRPRILVPLPPEVRRVLEMCFCTSCRTHATDAGVDVESLRRHLQDWLSDGGSQPLSRSVDLEDVTTYEQVRVSRCGELVRRVSEGVRESGSSSKIGIWTPQEPGRGAGVELSGVRDLVGVAMASQVTDLTQLSDIRDQQLSVLYLLLLGLDVGDDERDESFAADIRYALASSADEISIYNMGLLTERDLHNAVALVNTIAD